MSPTPAVASTWTRPPSSVARDVIAVMAVPAVAAAVVAARVPADGVRAATAAVVVAAATVAVVDRRAGATRAARPRVVDGKPC